MRALRRDKFFRELDAGMFELWIDDEHRWVSVGIFGGKIGPQCHAFGISDLIAVQTRIYPGQGRSRSHLILHINNNRKYTLRYKGPIAGIKPDQQGNTNEERHQTPGGQALSGLLDRQA